MTQADVTTPDVTTPDVTVIVPVYNTMPYLITCLDSLVDQTIGLGRMQVITVDDGSTDGSGAEVERYASDHPQTFTTIHQPNSGGPAGPCNRGLDVATGRYVFFLGADDYLGAETLERLVSKADEWESDVIFGKMEGVGGRRVHQKIFAKTERNLNFTDFPLAYALSNTKLFRRSLIEDHRIRYALDLRVGSDQPFVVEALLRARRTSVLTDYTYYYAVRRTDASNITYASGWRARLEDIGAVVRHIADIVEPGETRDAILSRHFVWELGKLVRLEIPKLSHADQKALADGVGSLVTAYLSKGISHRLWAQARLRLRLVEAGELAVFHRVLQYQEHTPQPPMALRQGRAFSWFPGFADPDTGFPDEWYEITAEGTWDRLVRSIAIGDVQLDGTRLALGGQVGVTADSESCVRLALLTLSGDEPAPPNRRFAAGDDVPEAIEFPVSLISLDVGGSAGLLATIPLDQVDAGGRATDPVRWSLRLRVDVGQWTYDLPIPSKDCFQLGTSRRRLEQYRITVWSAQKGPLIVRRERLSSSSSLPRTLLPRVKKP